MLIPAVNKQKAYTKTTKMSTSWRSFQQAISIEYGQSDLEQTLKLKENENKIIIKLFLKRKETYKSKNRCQIATLLKVNEKGVGQQWSPLPPVHLDHPRASHRSGSSGGNGGGGAGSV